MMGERALVDVNAVHAGPEREVPTEPEEPREGNAKMLQFSEWGKFH